MKAVGFDVLEYGFLFLFRFLFLVLRPGQETSSSIERMYENYDRQNVAGQISNNDMCVGDDIDVP